MTLEKLYKSFAAFSELQPYTVSTVQTRFPGTTRTVMVMSHLVVVKKLFPYFILPKMENAVLSHWEMIFTNKRLDCPSLSFDNAWVFSSNTQGYGPANGSRDRRFSGRYRLISGCIRINALKLIDSLDKSELRTIRYPQFGNLNKPHRKSPVNSGFVNLDNFYNEIDNLWREDSLGFDDICMSYKDRQYVTQRPNDNCPFCSFYRGSAMGVVVQ